MLRPLLLLLLCSACDSEGEDFAPRPDDAAPRVDAGPDSAPDAEAPEPAAPAAPLPARLGVAGLGGPGNVAVMAEKAGIEWSQLRARRREDGSLDTDAILASVDCLVLPGGADIDPARFGEEAHSSVRLISEARAEFDFAVLEAALELRMPILGLCLGGQELTVALGGGLVQDIPSEIEEHLDHRAEHAIQIVAGTLMDELYDGDSLRIFSNHHQAAEDGAGLGEGLRVSARSSDGVVEAFEAVDRARYPFLFGTQYHPEQQLETDLHDGLMAGFKAACLAYQAEHPRALDEPDHGTIWDYGACQSDLGAGVCVDTGTCGEGGGTASPGFCPGPAEIQCCTSLACETGSGVAGACFSTELCDQLERHREAYLCPGDSTVQCCLGEP